MAQAEKYKRVMSVIERRISRGDYLLNPIPGERKIAEETGVSHMTARKAVLALLDRKVLVRRTNGSLEINPTYHATAGAAQVVLLYPAYASAYLARLCQIVFEVADQAGRRVRPVQYAHWDDPVVVSAVSNSAGAIVIPISLDAPEHVIEAMRSNRVIALDLSFAEHGIPSVQLFPDSHIFRVFEHLQGLGHVRIDCVSAHTHNPEIERRIQLWKTWCYRHGITGELHEHPAPPFKDPTPFGYDAMKKLLERGPLQATAFVGTTFPAAVGAMRALWDHGLTVGRDVSVAAINIESPATFMKPSVTGLDMPSAARLMRGCFAWLDKETPWQGPVLLRPVQPAFFTGESTGPAKRANL